MNTGDRSLKGTSGTDQLYLTDQLTTPGQSIDQNYLTGQFQGRPWLSLTGQLNVLCYNEWGWLSLGNTWLARGFQLEQCT